MGGPTPAVNGLLNTRSQITQVTSCGADGPTASLLATQADRAFMAASSSGRIPASGQSLASGRRG
jgi:hypothetical protein